MIKYNGFTVDQMIEYIDQQGLTVEVLQEIDLNGERVWRIALTGKKYETFDDTTLFRATKKAFERFANEAIKARKAANRKLDDLMAPLLSCRGRLEKQLDKVGGEYGEHGDLVAMVKQLLDDNKALIETVRAFTTNPPECLKFTPVIDPDAPDGEQLVIGYEPATPSWRLYDRY